MRQKSLATLAVLILAWGGGRSAAAQLGGEIGPGNGGGGTGPGDGTPETITTLHTTDVGRFHVTLAWNAPGNDGPGSSEAVSMYQIHYRDDGPVTEENFDWSQVVYGAPSPAAPGTPETFTVGLS